MFAWSPLYYSPHPCPIIFISLNFELCVKRATSPTQFTLYICKPTYINTVDTNVLCIILSQNKCAKAQCINIHTKTIILFFFVYLCIHSIFWVSIYQCHFLSNLYSCLYCSIFHAWPLTCIFYFYSPLIILNTYCAGSLWFHHLCGGAI